jgi:FAD synthase
MKHTNPSINQPPKKQTTTITPTTPKIQTLRDVPTGVYLGWASVKGGKPCKAVVNVGYSPTFVGQVRVFGLGIWAASECTCATISLCM